MALPSTSATPAARAAQARPPVSSVLCHASRRHTGQPCLHRRRVFHALQELRTYRAIHHVQALQTSARAACPTREMRGTHRKLTFSCHPPPAAAVGSRSPYFLLCGFIGMHDGNRSGGGGDGAGGESTYPRLMPKSPCVHPGTRKSAVGPYFLLSTFPLVFAASLAKVSLALKG